MLNRKLSLINVVLGLWVVISSFLLWRWGTAYSINAFITGVIVALSGLLALRMPIFRFVGAAGGVWLIASLFAWPNYSSPVVWNNALVGAAVALASLVGPEQADMVSS